MTPEDDGILRRWARRKRAARGPQAADAAAPPLEIPPSAETIDLDEIAGWLKRNVPPAWKTAALRRLWVADPAIRDFIGMADYAWDWNTPGGAPGYGPLRAADDVAALLKRVIGAPEPAATQAEAANIPPDSAPAIAPAALPAPRVAQPPPPAIAAAAVPAEHASFPHAPLEVLSEAPSEVPPIRWRDGKATPA